ncbi:Transcriptional regulatory protein YpdB [Austwickia sp. TVS 96-490-7B]|uniref:LytR/AlgR family response regulator transcription factor n=1 Tax=Austwickia sp. TVS 96-490-7B TaxID=2830843 RepID=UPI001C58E0D6|nr:LytTR family DNA-binding domain-containing protein [Austwickia sp. TVS 96-490-7B]MBW3084905.1 Transcriptional regulatory protein YpdB [Austwickia sp. TVS 96-490-7B]
MSSDAPAKEGLAALVVDDEIPALSELAWLLNQDPRIATVRTATSGADALRALDATPADVVFCDINMPGLDGLELARVLGRFAERPQVVFVTAYEKHAVDAFEVSATDYLVKPIREERLYEAVRRVMAARHNTAPLPPVPTPEDETIPVELGGVTTFVQRSDIIYVQAQGDYARLHTRTASHLIRVSLTTLEERWASAGFVRIHRSTLVSLPAVTQVRTERGRCVVVLNGIELQVSRRHTRELRERLLRLPGQERG